MVSHPTPVLSHPDELGALDPVQVRGPAPAPTRLDAKPGNVHLFDVASGRSLGCAS